MTRRENTLRAIRFERPESIPMNFHINAACWHHYDQDALQDLMEAHRVLFPDFSRQPTVTPRYELNQLKDHLYTDPWGCVWQTADDGITGSVQTHPLADWSTLAGYARPDPDTTDGTYPIEWGSVEARVVLLKDKGELVVGGLPHGHTFLRLQDIRGYENLTFDMADRAPELPRLIEMIESFNYEFVLKWLKLEPDIMSFPEDLGMQHGPMISPDHFRAYIKPVYRNIMKPARERGSIVHMHSDGDIRALIDDIIEGGVDVINLQDLVNGLEWIAAKFARRTCVELDIDRQLITPAGTPEQIDRLIREEIETLGSKEGGLMMVYGLYPGVPLENVDAVMTAMERYAWYFA